MTKRPSEYRNLSNTLSEMKRVVDELGYFPTAKELYKRRFHGLVKCVYKHHGGLNKLRELMGYELEQKPPKYWKNFSNVEETLKLISKDLGHFPTQDELKKRGYGSLRCVIAKYHGGLNSVKERLGFDIIKKSNHYWQNFDNIRRELEPIIEKLGHFPTQKELCKIGRADLLSAIVKKHGGLYKIRELLGIPDQNSMKQVLDSMLTDYMGEK